MAPFVILGTPRSRTAWLAEFLTHGARTCVHEPSRNWRGLDELRGALNDGQGISDSVLTLRWREIVAYRPDARIVVVHRAAEDVLASFRKAGLWHDGLPAVIDRIDAALCELAESVQAVPVLYVPFAAMTRRDVCARIWRHCRGDEIPMERWEQHKGRVIVADAERHINDAIKNAAGVLALYPELAAA